jgi:signal transduction histidine kinase
MVIPVEENEGGDLRTEIRAPHLDSLQSSGLLDTPPEQVFDRFTSLASRIVGAPVSLISLVDENRQFFKSQVGLPEPWASARETPLSHSFCQHVVATSDYLIINDAREHELVRSNKAIQDLGVIAYLGIPISAPSGQPIGSFCAIDTIPREWTEDEVEILTSLAQAVSTEIHLRMVAARLQENNMALLQSEQRRDEMVHMLVHDLRTPLSALFGGLQALEVLMTPDEEQKQMLDISLRGARSLSQMINTILDINRGDSVGLTVEQTEEEASVLINKAIEQVNQLSIQKELTLTSNVQPNLPLIPVDADIVIRVLVNLIGNAIAHTLRGGKIEISAELTDDGRDVLISVSDNGVGIPKAQFERIFEKFAQVSSTRNAVSSGLGLTFCKMAVEKHNGAIWLESEEGVGTTFYLTLPCAKA